MPKLANSPLFTFPPAPGIECEGGSEGGIRGPGRTCTGCHRNGGK